MRCARPLFVAALLATLSSASVAHAQQAGEPAKPSTTKEAAPEDSAPDESASSIDIAAYTFFGIGAGGFVASVVAGVYALDRRLALEQVCVPHDNCPVVAQPFIDEMNQAALASTIAGVAGLAAMATGAVLILIPEDDTEDDKADTATRVSPVIGAGSIGVSVSF